MTPDVDCVGCSWPDRCPCYGAPKSRKYLGHDLPSPDALLGIDPDWTGGLSVDEHMDEIRGDD